MKIPLLVSLLVLSVLAEDMPPTPPPGEQEIEPRFDGSAQDKELDIISQAVSHEYDTNATVAAAAMKRCRGQHCGAGGSKFKCGCHKGYCWTHCGMGVVSRWCYSTSGAFSHTKQWVKCTSELDCCSYWQCASSCGI